MLERIKVSPVTGLIDFVVVSDMSWRTDPPSTANLYYPIICVLGSCFIFFCKQNHIMGTYSGPVSPL